MKRSTFDTETIFGRSSRLQQTEISSWRSKYNQTNLIGSNIDLKFAQFSSSRLKYDTFVPGLRSVPVAVAVARTWDAEGR